MRLSRAGIALISTLLMGVILLMMLAALLAAARRGSFSSDHFRRREATRYVAEEAVAVMLARLREDPEGETDLVDQATVFGGGSYTVRFSETESVNNLRGDDLKPGPYGDVAPGNALLRIHARTQGYERIFDVMLGPPPNPPGQVDALVASGRLELHGDVEVAADAGFTDLTPVDANIVSNSIDDTDGLIKWTPLPTGGSISVEGAVQLPGTNPDALDFSGFTLNTDRLSGPKPLERVDIPFEIARARDRGLGTVSITSGTPLPSGEYYIDGPIDLPGDLILENTKLYVSGDLTVHGSIQGRGALFVGGSTTFKGSARVIPNAQESIALMSYGSVELTGFNGGDYMEQITGPLGTPSRQIWENTKQDMHAILEEIEQPGYTFLADSAADKRMQTLGHHFTDHPDGPDPLQDNKLLKLRDILLLQPSSETRNFMLSKIEFLRDHDNTEGASSGGIFGLAEKYHHPPGWRATLEAALREIKDGHTHDGLFDTVNDILAYGNATLPLTEFGGRDAVKALLINGLRALDMNRPGTAYFQGRLITNGWLYAGHEIAVVGSITVLGDPEVKELPSWSASPASAPDLVLEPGDVQLDGGTKITHTEDVVKAARETQGNLGVLHWLGH
ncbi:MAG: hypothetical protein WC314_08570 [Vulcanimicrobiota bacterium]